MWGYLERPEKGEERGERKKKKWRRERVRVGGEEIKGPN